MAAKIRHRLVARDDVRVAQVDIRKIAFVGQRVAVADRIAHYDGAVVLVVGALGRRAHAAAGAASRNDQCVDPPAYEIGTEWRAPEGRSTLLLNQDFVRASLKARIKVC